MDSSQPPAAVSSQPPAVDRIAIELIRRADDDGGGDGDRDGDAAAFLHSAHRIRAGLTIRQWLVACDQAALVAAVEARAYGLARHGRRAWLDDLLADGDRIELVRPIVADARAARFARVAAARPVRRRGDV